MKKILLSILLMSLFSYTFASGDDVDSADNIDLRFGWSVGGTMPLGMPASIRSLNSYSLRPNFQVGADYEHRLTNTWGIGAGLRFGHKGMKTDAVVMGYEMSMVKEGEVIEGYFTGNVVTDTRLNQITIPVHAVLHCGKRFSVKAGPYVAVALLKEFEGYAYDGYLRQDTPTGPRIMLGSTVQERGSYDFRDDLRTLNWGVDVDLDWFFTPQFGMYADVTWGFNGVFHSSFKTIRQTMYPIYGTIGVTYRIR